LSTNATSTYDAVVALPRRALDCAVATVLSISISCCFSSHPFPSVLVPPIQPFVSSASPACLRTQHPENSLEVSASLCNCGPYTLPLQRHVLYLTIPSNNLIDRGDLTFTTPCRGQHLRQAWRLVVSRLAGTAKRRMIPRNIPRNHLSGRRSLLWVWAWLESLSCKRSQDY
jgi:hypothetical protein